jgi:uncharacterized protein with von Willebrand factor type A (vWA) domain
MGEREREREREKASGERGGRTQTHRHTDTENWHTQRTHMLFIHDIIEEWEEGK